MTQLVTHLTAVCKQAFAIYSERQGVEGAGIPWGSWGSTLISTISSVSMELIITTSGISLSILCLFRQFSGLHQSGLLTPGS